MIDSGVALGNEVEYVTVLVAGALLVLLLTPLVLELLLTTVGALLALGGDESHESRESQKRQESQERRSGLPPAHVIARLVVVVPGHNEERLVGACVRGLVAASGPADTILVVAHNCVDRTAEIAATEGAELAVLDDPELRGKGNALAHGFSVAFDRLDADAVLVVDADSTVSRNLLEAVRASLGSAMVVQTRYEACSAGDTTKGRLQALSFLCKNGVRAMGRQRFGLSCGIFGNGFAMRREVLERVPYAAHSIVEDLEFHLALLKQGIRAVFVPEATVLAEVPATVEGQRTQTARWEGGRVQMVRAHGAGLLGRVCRGDLRLAEPLLDLLGLPMAPGVGLLAILAAFPVTAFRVCSGLGFLVLAAHLAVGVRISPKPWATARALVNVPWYVLKKVLFTPAILLMAHKRASWVKTSRATAEK